MLKQVIRISIAAIVLAVVAGLILQQLGMLPSMQATTSPAITVQASPAILQEVKRVSKYVVIQHYGSVDIDYTEAPSGMLNALKSIGIQQHYVVLLRGTVPAGFDLNEMSEADIWVSPDGKRAQVTLPAPKIFEEMISIDNEHTRVLAADDKCPDFLCTVDLAAFNKTIEPEGKRLLIESARKNEILRQAAVEGKLHYERLLNQLGIGEVRVVVQGYDL